MASICLDGGIEYVLFLHNYHWIPAGLSEGMRQREDRVGGPITAPSHDQPISGFDLASGQLDAQLNRASVRSASRRRRPAQEN